MSSFGGDEPRSYRQALMSWVSFEPLRNTAGGLMVSLTIPVALEVCEVLVQLVPQGAAFGKLFQSSAPPAGESATLPSSSKKPSF